MKRGENIGSVKNYHSKGRNFILISEGFFLLEILVATPAFCGFYLLSDYFKLKI